VSPPTPSINREVAALQQATQMILVSLDVDSVLHQILLIVRNHFGAYKCAIFLVDASANELYCRAQNGFDDPAYSLKLAVDGPGPVSRCAFTRAPLYLPDLDRDPVPGTAAGVRGELVLPLTVRDRLLGVLEIASDRPNAFSNDTIGVVSVFAGQAAIALEAARLYAAERHRMRQLELINLMARAAASARESTLFFPMLAELLNDTFEATQVAVVLCQTEEKLFLAGHSGTEEPVLDRLLASQRSGVIRECLALRTSVSVEDVAARPNWACSYYSTGSELCVPLVSQGEILGTIILAHTQPRFFSNDDRSIAQAAADICATAARNVQLEEALHRVSITDPLTGAFNQRYFHTALAHELSRARRYRKPFGLIVLDLCSFAEVNAAVGLEKGDEILRQVASTLKGQIRSHDILCRYVGDRFALVLPEIEAGGQATVLAKLQNALARMQPGDHKLSHPLTAAWATAQFPADGTGESELVKALLARLDAAKQQTSGAGA
jgi:diguanylate cyclase (GGDEF)-like protein